MAVRKGGLGKGLDSLISDTIDINTKKENTIEIIEKPTEIKIKISEIEPNREQPRKDFDEDGLEELAESIKEFGILQPLLVQKEKNYYKIIAGERRWRAAKKAGLKEVPVIIKEYTSQQIVEISLVENIQREDLNPIEEALAYKRLMDEFGLKQDQIAERVSKSRVVITNAMRLLKLDERVQSMLIADMISVGHGRAILAIEDKEEQYNLAMKIFDEKLSVREIEKIVKSILNPKKERLAEEVLSESEEAVYKDMQERMKSIIGTKVTINKKDRNKGKIEIEYYSAEELERIMELFQGMKE